LRTFLGATCTVPLLSPAIATPLLAVIVYVIRSSGVRAAGTNSNGGYRFPFRPW